MFNFFQKIVIYLSLGLPKGRPSYREALSPQKRAAGPVVVTTRPSNAGPLAKVLYFVYNQPLHTGTVPNLSTTSQQIEQR